MWEKLLIHLNMIVSNQWVTGFGNPGARDAKKVAQPTRLIASFHNGCIYAGNHCILFLKIRALGITLYSCISCFRIS